MKEPSLRRFYARCRYGQLHYRAGGAGTTEAALVLLHQTPSSSAEFIPFASEMARNRRVIAFDTPGFGMSDPPDSPVSMAGYAAAFADGLTDMAIADAGPLDLLGYHTGAYLAAELAIARPDLIGRVILAAIPFRPAAARAAKLAAAAPPAPPDAAGDDLFDFMRNIWAYSVTGRDPAIGMDRAITLFGERIRALHRATWPYQGVWRYDAEDRFARLTQPVLVLQPHDPQFDQWRDPVARIPRATVREFPHLTRDVFDIGAVELADAIRQWRPVEEALLF